MPATAQDEAAAMEQYAPLCHQQARRHSRLLGGRDGYYDDLVQIARMGVIYAVRRYRPDRGASPFTYTFLCVVGHVRTAARRIRADGFAGCQGQLDRARLPAIGSGHRRVGRGDEPLTVFDTIPCYDPPPACDSSDELWAVAARHAGLSWREKATLDLLRDGLTQADVGVVFGVTRTRVFQHWQAGARKLRRHPRAVAVLAAATGVANG